MYASFIFVYTLRYDIRKMFQITIFKEEEEKIKQCLNNLCCSIDLSKRTCMHFEANRSHAYLLYIHINIYTCTKTNYETDYKTEPSLIQITIILNASSIVVEESISVSRERTRGESTRANCNSLYVWIVVLFFLLLSRKKTM